MALCANCRQTLSRYSPGPLCNGCTHDARVRLGEPPHLDPSFWEDPAINQAAHTRDLQTLVRAYLDATGLTQEAFALLINRDQGTISKIVSGRRKRFAIEDLEAIRDGLHAPGHLFGLTPGPHETGPSPISGKPPQNHRESASSVEDVPESHAKDADVERRQLLHHAAALGLSAGTIGPISIRHLTDLALTTPPRDLDDWHLACEDHLHGLRTRPPAQVRDGLLIDLLSLDRQLKAATAKNLTELRRVQAALATLNANVMSRLGDHVSAIQWWRTARAAADASGDLELRLGTRATEAGHGLHGQRNPATVLRLTQSAKQIAGNSPSRGNALVSCSHAKALSALGWHQEAQRELDICADQFTAAPEPKGIMADYWKGGQLEYAQLVVHSNAGDESRTEQAMRRSLSVLDQTADRPYVAMVRLAGALCTVVNGGDETGTRQATEILSALPPTQQVQMIIETAHDVVRAVPPERRDRPAVRDLLALASGSTA